MDENEMSLKLSDNQRRHSIMLQLFLLKTEHN